MLVWPQQTRKRKQREIWQEQQQLYREWLDRPEATAQRLAQKPAARLAGVQQPTAQPSLSEARASASGQGGQASATYPRPYRSKTLLIFDSPDSPEAWAGADPAQEGCVSLLALAVALLALAVLAAGFVPGIQWPVS